MLLAKKRANGEKYYVNAFTGKEVKLQRVAPNKAGKIPNGIYGRFIKPAMTIEEKAALRFSI